MKPNIGLTSNIDELQNLSRAANATAKLDLHIGDRPLHRTDPRQRMTALIRRLPPL